MVRSMALLAIGTTRDVHVVSCVILHSRPLAGVAAGAAAGVALVAFLTLLVLRLSRVWLEPRGAN
jgi:hypothetical protein